MGWTLDRYKASTIAEYNLAAAGYWRNWERFTVWQTREIIWWMIQGNVNIKQSDKPKRRDAIIKMSIDKEEKREPEKITPDDLKMFERMQFNKQ